MKKVDAVYIVGGISLWNDNELRYSLRSLEKHVTGIRNVYIVGRFPSFLNEYAIHIPYNDIHTNKARNIMMKVYRASKDKRISQDFFFLNDDYFFVKNVHAPEYPFYYKCDLNHTSKINASNEYGYHVRETLKYLKERSLPIKNFDTHKPILYNKRKLIQIVDNCTWPVKFGHILKSLYCNTLGIEGQFLVDTKINHPYFKSNLLKFVQQTPDLFSIGDLAINSSMKELMNELYPNKSKYEK